MKKLYLLLLCCVVSLCGCDSNSETTPFFNEIYQSLENYSFTKDCVLTTNIPYYVHDNILDSRASFLDYEYRFLRQDDKVCIVIKFKVDISHKNYGTFNYELYKNNNIIKSDKIYVYKDEGQDYAYPLLCIRNLEPGDYYLKIRDNK